MVVHKRLVLVDMYQLHKEIDKTNNQQKTSHYKNPKNEKFDKKVIGEQEFLGYFICFEKYRIL